jgi:hypothetical protein
MAVGDLVFVGSEHRREDLSATARPRRKTG